MKLAVKLRIIGLTSAIGLMGLLVAFLIVRSQSLGASLRARLKTVDSESFRIADEFSDALRQLNNSLYWYGSGHAKEDLDKFLKASDELNRWIDEQQSKLTTAREKDLMQQLDVVYDGYLNVANAVQAKVQSLGQQSATMADFMPLLKEAQALFDLGQALARTHYESRSMLLAEARRNTSEIRLLQLVSIGCLFVFGVALAAMVYRDMIKPLRAKLVQGQALLERQEKLASLGLLAAGVAHEIRNPLTAIKAALFIQLKKLPPGSQVFADAKIVEREILRLEKIVSDFLLFARPDEPQLTIISADAPLQEVHNLLAPALSKNGIQLILKGSPPLKFKADAAKIKQVLINLVQNAADASGRNGVVQLSARQDRRRIGGREMPVVIFEVADNGKGISPEVQKRLFDPFFTTKEAGTGLGLSIAASIVQKHGGAMEYQTRVDSGTTFGIIFPLVTE